MSRQRSAITTHLDAIDNASFEEQLDALDFGDSDAPANLYLAQYGGL